MGVGMIAEDGREIFVAQLAAEEPAEADIAFRKQAAVVIKTEEGLDALLLRTFVR